MNLIKELGPIDISLPEPEDNITNLLYAANALLNKPEWRATLFTGEKSNDQAMWLNEARAKVQRCVGKLEKILEATNVKSNP